MPFSLRSGLCLGAGLLSYGAAISLPAADAGAKSAATCGASRSPAGVPALTVSSARSPRVSGSVLFSAGTSRVTLTTSGAVRVGRGGHTPAAQASLEFCLRAGRVRRSVKLAEVAPGGLLVTLTAQRRLALSHTAGRHTLTRTVALAGKAELVQVVVQRSRARTTLMVNGARRVNVSAAIGSQARVYLTTSTGRSVAAPITVSGAGTSAAGRSPALISALANTPAAPTAAATPPAVTPSTAVSSPTTPAAPPTSGATVPAAPTATAPTAPTATAPTEPTVSAPTTTTTVAPPPTTTTVAPPPTTPTTTTSAPTAPGISAAAASAVPSNPFSPTSFWNAPLPSNAPIDPNSQTYVNDLNSQISQYGLWMNTNQYSTPAYVVPADQPTVKVTLDTWGPDLQQQFDAVPIPAGATAAAGTDEHMTVWQPSTDKLWEFWVMHQVNGTWHAQWGGEMDNVSTSPGYFTHSGQTNNWGATATGLPLLGGLITMADYQRGSINHAIALAVPQTESGVFSWPAQRTDGKSTASTALPEGIRFRLNPNLNIDSLHLTYLDWMIAHAMQTYGIVIRDTSGCVCLYAQDPTPTGSNPWAAPFDGWGEGTFLSWIPWDQMEALQTQLKG